MSTLQEKIDLISKTDPQQVIPQLFIGGLECSAEVHRLQGLGITHVMSVGGPTAAPPQLFKRKEMRKVDDHPDYNIAQHFDECVSWIDDAIRNGGSVLIHCYHGVSRSATIILAFMIFYKKMTLKEAYTILKQARSVVRPNRGFVQQLKQYESRLLGTQLIEVITCNQLNTSNETENEPQT